MKNRQISRIFKKLIFAMALSAMLPAFAAQTYAASISEADPLATEPYLESEENAESEAEAAEDIDTDSSQDGRDFGTGNNSLTNPNHSTEPGSVYYDENIDYDYTGKLDQETSLSPDMLNEMKQAEVDESAQNGRVQVTDGVYFDRTQQMFIYTASDGITEVLSSVADGMIVQKPVKLVLPEAATFTLYLDGVALDSVDTDSIGTYGDYNLSVMAGGGTEQLLSFSIAPSYSNRYQYYQMPSGFMVTDVTKDDEAFDFSLNSVDMTVDGHYVIYYSAPRTQDDYVLDIHVDTVAPELEFIGIGDDGRATGPVTLSGYAADDIFEITLNGREFKLGRDGVLKESGEYHIKVSDQAGNSTSYILHVPVYLDNIAWIFVGIVAAAIIVILVYLIIRRKKLRIK